MKRRTQLKLLLAVVSTVAGLLALETGLRLLTHIDADGNHFFRSDHLLPHRMPLQTARTTLDHYLKSTNSSLIYDADLGWRPRPHFHDYNSAGIWSEPREYPVERPDDRLRIAVFGGSFARGGDHDVCWSHQLERHLNELGTRAEVLNFGVASYSLDQSLLRWRKDGRAFHPHVVLFGFNAGYCLDNLNMIRPLQHPGTEIFFLKPRFVFADGTLNLINVPTPKPSEVVSVLEHVGNWPLVAHEAFYRPADFQDRWLWHSRLAAVVQARLADLTPMDGGDFYQPTQPAGRLALEILREFQRDVQSHQGRLIVVHLPSEPHLQTLAEGRNLAFEDLMWAIGEDMEIIRPDAELLQAAAGASATALFQDNHYVPEVEVLIGRTVAAFLHQNASGRNRP